MLLALLSFLMISTWRYWSFKDLNLLRPRSPLILVADGRRHFRDLELVAAGAADSGLDLCRRAESRFALGGIIRRHFRHTPQTESGDTGWLKPSHWSAAKRCWAREVREVLGETALGQHVRLVAAAEEETGTLTEIGGSAAFLAKLDPDAVEDADALILAGSPESSKIALGGESVRGSSSI